MRDASSQLGHPGDISSSTRWKNVSNGNILNQLGVDPTSLDSGSEDRGKEVLRETVLEATFLGLEKDCTSTSRKSAWPQVESWPGAGPEHGPVQEREHTRVTAVRTAAQMTTSESFFWRILVRPADMLCLSDCW